MSHNQRGRFRILSLDGGGVRGAFGASFLATIEDKLGEPLSSYFDLIAGTSTGALIAAGIAHGKSASTICELYETKSDVIFSRPPKIRSWKRFGLNGLKKLPVARSVAQKFADAGFDAATLEGPKYENKGLRNELYRVFGDSTLEDVRHSRLLTLSADLTRGTTVAFKTPHLPDMFRDRHYSIVDVLTASAAAPIYFPPAKVGTGNDHVDGGLWANSPTLCALAEAVRIGRECRRPEVDLSFGFDQIEILSIGTGNAAAYQDIPREQAGLLWWAPRLFNVMGTLQSYGTHFQAEALLGSHYRRVDFKLPESNWMLDDTKVVPQLVHLGHQKALEEWKILRDCFCDVPRVRHEPFPEDYSAKKVVPVKEIA